MRFEEVRKILDDAIAGWTVAHGGAVPRLVQKHHEASFMWDTKAHLLAAKARGVLLIQDGVRHNGNGAKANLVVALANAKGVIVDGVPLGQMPATGPFLTATSPAGIATIIRWIDDDCPD